MSTDISNTFIHHIINDRIRDLSNNPRAQFLGMLVNLLNDNNLNSNLAMLPLANNYVVSLPVQCLNIRLSEVELNS